MNSPSNFAIYYASDAYSTAKKIMGRQSAGKAFMRGLARTWPQGTLTGVGQGQASARVMLSQLQGDGFKGTLRWTQLPDWEALELLGALYYPAPPSKELCFSRNAFRPDALSLIGVTHTLSSTGPMDHMADLVLPPFKSWDALICTSQVAHTLASKLQAEMREWMQEQTGATRFNAPQMPVIPLGVDCPAFAPVPGQRAPARQALGLQGDEVVFLFSGRLSFHAKANPAPMYQALERAAAHAKAVKVVCIEAGVFPNEAISQGFAAARAALAPSVRFVPVDGNDLVAYQQAWQGADVFVSMADNIQETFGLTPVEAMAAGLPVIVSDWNGYKDTVRDGKDGIRVPTLLPPAGVGNDLAMRHALELDTYDFYIGRTSLATVVDPEALAQACVRLATDAALRQQMGAQGQARALADYDWPVILRRYNALAQELAALRQAAGAQSPQRWLQRADPFERFAHFSSATVGGNWTVQALPEPQARLRQLLGLAMANYALDDKLLPAEAMERLLACAERDGVQNVNQLLAVAGAQSPTGIRCLMWLAKFAILRLSPPGQTR
jgi:glycosyltransferase involved in cell wall biosynthesis